MIQNTILRYSFNVIRSSVSGVGLGLFMKHMFGNVGFFGFTVVHVFSIFIPKIDKGVLHGAVLSNTLLSADLAYSYYSHGQLDFNTTNNVLSPEVQVAFLLTESVFEKVVAVTHVSSAHPVIAGATVAGDLGYAYYNGDIEQAYSVRYTKAGYSGLRRVYEHGTSFDDIGHNFESIKFIPTALGFKIFDTPYLDGIRQEYNDNVAKLRHDVLSQISSDVSLLNNVTFCKEVSETREMYKQQSQFKTPLFSIVPIFARQLYKYGNHTGMSSEDIISRCFQDVTGSIFSSLKTDGGDFDLSVNDSYNRQLSLAKALKFQVMPEQITESNIECAFSDGEIRNDLEVCGIVKLDSAE